MSLGLRSQGDASMAEKSNETVAAPAAQKQLSKTDAGGKSFAKLGRTAMPKAVQADVKKAFGIDVSDTLVSSIKTELTGKPAAKQPAAKQPAVNPPAAKAAAPKAERVTPAANGRHPVVSI